MGLAAALVLPAAAFAHCDTMDGPVVRDGRLALETGDVTPVLKWVTPEAEAEVREAFVKTAAARKLGAEAREVADMWFFETVVRVHRAGEGAPYTGLKPAGTPLEPPVEAADRALETGSVDTLVKAVTDAVAAGIRERFSHAVEARKHADKSLHAGREFVQAYVVFVHHVERLHLAATTDPGEHAGGEQAGPAATHGH